MKNLVLIVLIVLLTTNCFGFSYRHLQDIKDSVIKVEVEVKIYVEKTPLVAKQKDGKVILVPDRSKMMTKETSFTAFGTGMKIFQNNKISYYVTCEHILNPIEKEFTKEANFFSPYITYVKFLSRKIRIPLFKVPFMGKDLTIGKTLEVVDTSKSLDIAILKSTPISSAQTPFNKRKFKTYKYNWFSNYKILEGMEVCAVGYPGCLNKLAITFGRVVTKTWRWKSEYTNMFITDVHAFGGNSGGPVFIIRNGAFYFVGIARLLVADKYLGVVKIDHIRGLLKKNKLEFIYRGK